MKTYVFSKDALTDTEVGLDIAPLLKYGETLVSVTLQVVSPISTPALDVSLTSDVADPNVRLLLKAGQASVSYGFQIQITTDARQLAALVAVTVTQDVMNPYTTGSPEAYADLVDTIEAGNGAIGTAVFSFPADIDPSGGYVNWELLDSQGTVYANGNAFDYAIQSNGLSNTVFAKSVINVPSSVPPSDINSKYQLRYTLTLNANGPDQQQYLSFENITVTGSTSVPLGTQDQIELKGKKATLSIVVDKLYDYMTLELYRDNQLLGQAQITEYQRVSSGYYYAGTFDTASLEESLEPYTVVWNYGLNSQPNNVYSETASLWITNPSILQAINDVKAKINKARTTLYGQPDTLFPAETIMLWLRRARDSFNGAHGVFTSFTMTNAKGPIREYWLMWAEIGAIESQYMAEGEKAFNFSGASISLDVDRTGFLDSAASKIQSRLDNEFKAFKQNLIYKGQTRGDGSADPSKLAPGALGSVGLTLTAASPWGPGRAGYPYPNTGVFK